MSDQFLPRYLAAFDDIPGWCSPDAALMFMAYHQLLADEGLAGDVLEIGVYHGLSAIGIAALRGEGRRFVAADLFDEPQSQNGAAYGVGYRQKFIANMRRFYDDLSFLTTIAAPSATIRPEHLGPGFSFCHIDGGHSAAEAHADLELCSAITLPGGLIALDDYFNPSYPGVAEAAIRFGIEHPGTLRPIAIGPNKALFQREPAPFDLNARFADVFPYIRGTHVPLWDVPSRLFGTTFSVFIDTARSTPRRLEPASDRAALRARIEPDQAAVTVTAGEKVSIPVQVTNLSPIAFAQGNAPFGLSYHLMTAERQVLRFDHPRAWFTNPLPPGDSRTLNLCVDVPYEPGTYQVEFDIVWEGVLWMKDLGNPTAVIQLTATADDLAVAHTAADALSSR